MPACTRAASLLGVDHDCGADFTLPGVEPHHGPDRTLEPVHLEADLSFDIAARRVEGAVTVEFVARTDGEQAVVLDAVDLDVQSVAVDGADSAFRHDGERIFVSFESAVPRGAARRVTVRYAVESPLTGLLFGDGWAASDHETERARYWLPCVDHPSVRTKLDLHLSSDAAHTILANGRLVSESIAGGRKRAHWRLEQPCPAYLLCVALGDLVRAEGGDFDGLPIAFFGAPRTRREDLAACFGKTAAMLRWMTGRLSRPFPFPKYFQFAVPGIGGAMENISLVSWDEQWVFDARLRAEYGWLLDLVNVHEMGHSWFGDAVVIRDFAHAWLKESWATYLESCWLLDQEGRDSYDFQIWSEVREYREEADSSYVRPIVTRKMDSSWSMYDRHLYPGGAVRLHMLRRQLGDEDFWGGVADYLAAHEGGVAETDEFRRALELRSGRSLTRYFDQWLHAPGYPKLRANWKHDGKRGSGELTVEQTQVDDKRGVGLFDLPLVIAVETADGAWERHRLDLRGERAVIVVPLTKAPKQIVLDPDGDLLFALEFQPGDDMLQQTLKAGPSLAAKLRAVDAMAKKPSRANLKALAAAYRSGPHWGLRVAIGRALADAATIEASRLAAELLQEEADPRVPAWLAPACGKVRDEGVARSLRRYLGRADLPYRARSAVLGALGAQRADIDEALLVEAASDGGFYGWVRRGAYGAIAAHRGDAGRALLVDRVASAQPRALDRAAAATALAATARFADRRGRAEALDALGLAAQDPSSRVRIAVAGAIATLGEPAGAAVLDALAHAIPRQEVPKLRRAQRSLASAGDGTKTSRLEKRLDEVSDQLKKVQQRLDAVEAQAAKKKG